MLRRLAVLLALLLPLTVLVSSPANAGPESEFVSRINGARSSRGIRPYAVRSDLTAVARRQAQRMASQGRMYHNPNLGGEVSGWSAVGENVGQGPSVSSIHDAFMSSSSHRSNILSTSFTEVGVGVAQSSNGTLFVSQVFRRPSGAVYSPPPAPRQPVYRQPVAPRRASRSAPRKPLVAPKKPAKKRVVVDPAPRKLRAAWAMYRKASPEGSLQHAVVFLRANGIIDRHYSQ